MNRIDAYSATRTLIENAFSHLTWHADACEKTGFKGISPIWKDDPAWYFWLNHINGGFLLRLHAEEPLVDNQYVSFSLHYFPMVDDAAYQDLSVGEKGMLSDETIFDQTTNTPQFEAYEQFISTFVVAELGFVIDPDNQLQLLLYCTEKAEDHPVYAFLDLLIGALNFQSKRHHQQVFLLQEGQMMTSFLSYSEPVLKQFLNEFALHDKLSEQLVSSDRQNRWLQAAHMEAVCSMSGACSCSH
jgi:hypothetical protein